MKTLKRALPLLLLLAGAAMAQPADYVSLPGGVLRTALPPDGKQAPALVSPFFMRTRPVSNAEFLVFVTAHPKWRRDAVPVLFADNGYLTQWAAPDAVGKGAGDQPVTQVSWFAAEAFCEAENARLPTWHEWEFVAAADATRPDARSDPAWRARILSWYSRPGTSALPKIGQTGKNVYGVYDMHGLVWEWVEDYAGLMVSVDNRVQGDPDVQKFCGAGALSVSDRENYAVLMRIAMLSSLKGADTTRNLGFRCARDGVKKQEKTP
ncbi:MAG: formylglycine-generating enzyme family protein [bacterium]|nr:formylglycine-generating enzyme family protein [bacterium]